ncbi:unnamed protein product, partial [Polarella glacialis]
MGLPRCTVLYQLHASSQASAKLAFASGRVRDLLASNLPLVLAGTTLLGLALFVGGIVIGTSSHKSGFVVGGAFALTCLGITVSTLDAWERAKLVLTLLELHEASPRAEILQQLQEYNKFSTKTLPVDPGELDALLVATYSGLTPILCKKLVVAFQWGPLFFVAAAISSAVATGVVESIPTALHVLSICVAALGGLAMIFGLYVLRRFFMPVISQNLKAQVPAPAPLGLPGDPEMGPAAPCTATMLELHVNMLRRKLGSTPHGQAAARAGLQ